jgi:hypothetical protein
MGFVKRWDITDIQHQLGRMIVEIRSPYNDGWTASGCKQELYQLKCYIEDAYKDLPTFVGEEKWEQERLIQVLRK